MIVIANTTIISNFEELGITFSGTIGVLVQAIRAVLISRDDGNHVLVQMIVLGFHSPNGSLDGLA